MRRAGTTSPDCGSEDPKNRCGRRILRASAGAKFTGGFVEDPFCDVLDAEIDTCVVNLGVENAGVDAYLNDPGAMTTASGAHVAIIQLTGCHNTSNRFYSVHPRRNDRFLKASVSLRALYPEMDFTEVHFTRHLLGQLQKICPKRFEEIVREVCLAWRSRMVSLIRQINGRTILLLFSNRKLTETPEGLGDPTPFMSKSLIQPLRAHVAGLVEVVPDAWSQHRIPQSQTGMDIARLERLPGPSAHFAVADKLAAVVKPML